MISLDEAGSGRLAARMAAILGPDGEVVRDGGEFRPQQLEMAEAVATALRRDDGLAVEAGTGVGKSMAYLFPAALHAMENGRRAVISTHTINLQEQLLKKDIPAVSRLLGRDIPVVLLKGRRNYLCPQRLKAAMRQTGDLFTSGEEAELRRIAAWAVETTDGTLGDLPFSPSPKVWAQVCSETRICTPRRCPPARCFFQEAWHRAGQARLIVVNHNLYFTLLAGVDEDVQEADEGFLFPGDFAIFDEAHTLEAVAARQLGLQVGEGGLQFELQRLYNPRTRKGLFVARRDGGAMREAEAAQEAVAAFFEQVRHGLPEVASREWRVSEPGLAPDLLADPLLAVESRARKLARDEEDENAANELHDLADRIRDGRQAVDAFLEQSMDGHVYWVEREGASQTLSLVAAPIDVAPVLRQRLFHGRRAAILTSATLGTGGDDLAYFRGRIGAEAARPVRIGSPFNFREQMEIHLVRSIPAPGTDAYDEALAGRVMEFLRLGGGRAFVLFTSYRLLRAVADELRRDCEAQGWEVFVQGEGMPRRRMLEAFAAGGRGVLFGTESFWTGVDVPGEALSNVIITRLPFAVPDHPLTAAKIEKIEADGGNAFMDFSVPEAVLKLRQGVGRLIRRATDHGRIVILDNRILTKRYGRLFLAALPDARRVEH